ncbi:hypothetical protein FVE85_1832 [Porphyridium purpureum]|uniref:Uncharacterized protein n=1 Tax=Porphyridium purpureum TaxID=35688 RepID=A0A5J4YYY6_PORPP|nr:hypothetical protein FVE85_1832 [Porphyridium purpureum]|eukprot:POR2607..scf209_3
MPEDRSCIIGRIITETACKSGTVFFIFFQIHHSNSGQGPVHEPRCRWLHVSSKGHSAVALEMNAQEYKVANKTKVQKQVSKTGPTLPTSSVYTHVPNSSTRDAGYLFNEYQLVDLPATRIVLMIIALASDFVEDHSCPRIGQRDLHSVNGIKLRTSSRYILRPSVDVCKRCPDDVRYESERRAPQRTKWYCMASRSVHDVVHRGTRTPANCSTRKVDFMLYALLQAYPRAIPYRRMMRALVDAGCMHHHRDARSFIWYSCKRYRAISIQNTKSMVFERFKRLTKGQCKALTIFPIEMNDVGYMKYLERTRHIAVPDLARREVEKILQVPNLPPANIILPPVREAIGEELFAAKYKYVSPQQVPEKFLAAMKFKHLTSNDQGLQDGPAQHQAEAQDNIHLTAQTTASEHVQ